MKIPWDQPRCIVCLQERGLTSEHVVPQMLGGRLQSPFLCAICNSRLGTAHDSQLKSDPRVRKAALELAGTLPGLVAAIEEGGVYIGKSAVGEFQGTVKKGVFRPRPLRPGDGSLLLSTPEAREAVERMLRKGGRDSEVAAALEKLDGAPTNERIEVAPGIEVIEWQTEQIRPGIELGTNISDTWPLKTAYEFLACCLGGAIYSATFDGHRKMLMDGPWSENLVTVERLEGEHLAPIHGLLLETNNPHTIVQVRLFRRICYRVHFKRIAVTGHRWIYSHNLAEPTEEFAILENEGEPRAR